MPAARILVAAIIAGAARDGHALLVFSRLHVSGVSSTPSPGSLELHMSSRSDALIIRFDLGTGRTDTLATIALNGVTVTADRDANGTRTDRRVDDPLAAVDDWAMTRSPTTGST